MSASNEVVARAFSSHDFAAAAPSLAADIEWRLIGGQILRGREAVLAAIGETEAYLAKVRTTYERFDAYVGDGFVVIDSVAAYADDGPVTRVASCDLYRFSGDELTGITSYTVELPVDGSAG